MKSRKNLSRPSVAINLIPRVIGAARNEHGTRLAHRVECIRCQKTDHVPVRVAGPKKGYCRSCAELLLKTFDAGRIIAAKKVSRSCSQCYSRFEVSEKIDEKKDDLLCLDCLRGFDVWRGKAKPSSGKKNIAYELIKSSAKTMIRKRLNDSI